MYTVHTFTMLKRTPQDNLEDESVGVIKSFFNSNRWEFTSQIRDKSGIDGEIEIVHGIERTGRLLKCQIKAGTSYISSETDNHLRLKIERKYLDHWSKMSMPVLLFFYHPLTRIVYWKAIKEHVAAHPTLLSTTGDTCVVVFEKEQDTLEPQSLASLEAVEARTFSYDRIIMETGASEIGWSNWFPVKSFPSLWQADTEVVARSVVVPHLDREYTFTVKGNRLLTFSNIQARDCELRSFVNTESIRPLSIGDCPTSVVVELLNQALFLLAKKEDLLYHSDRFYFSAAILKTPQNSKFSYVSLKGREEERAKIYIQKAGNRIEYKHHAVRLSFVQHVGDWYLQVEPDWYFTYPFGPRPHRAVVGARITSEKAHTYNKDYLYLLHFWRQFLSGNTKTISIPCSRPDDMSGVEVSASPFEFEFCFRMFNDYSGPKTKNA